LAVASTTNEQGGFDKKPPCSRKRRRASYVKAIAAGLIAAFLGAGVADATTGWQVVSSGSSSGAYTGTAIKATIHHPKALGIRLAGRRIQFGTARVACTKGSSHWSYSHKYKHTGTYKLPPTRRADSCLVTASVSGNSSVTVQILKAR
jgi:hypothetical protein